MTNSEVLYLIFGVLLGSLAEGWRLRRKYKRAIWALIATDVLNVERLADEAEESNVADEEHLRALRATAQWQRKRRARGDT